jgi:hypothetical protein
MNGGWIRISSVIHTMQPQDDSSSMRSKQDKKPKKKKEKVNTVPKDDKVEYADESEGDEIATLFPHLRVSQTATLKISADQLLHCIFPFPFFPDTDYYKWKNTTKNVRESCFPLRSILKQ